MKIHVNPTKFALVAAFVEDVGVKISFFCPKTSTRRYAEQWANPNCVDTSAHYFEYLDK